MNTTKATIVLGALLSAGILLAQAPEGNQAPAANAPQAEQSHPGRHHRNFDPAQQAAHLGKRLGLSSDQVAQITPILTDRQQQMQSLRADASLTQQDRHAKARAIMQDSKGKIGSSHERHAKAAVRADACRAPLSPQPPTPGLKRGSAAGERSVAPLG